MEDAVYPERDASMRIFRYEVPVDDRVHHIKTEWPPIHVSCRDLHTVEFWATSGVGSAEERDFIVVGTGHPLPKDFIPVGTAIDPSGNLVWHLMARAISA